MLKCITCIPNLFSIFIMKDAEFYWVIFPYQLRLTCSFLFFNLWVLFIVYNDLCILDHLCILE